MRVFGRNSGSRLPPVFDFRAHFCHFAPIETHAFGFRLPANAGEGHKRFPIRRYHMGDPLHQSLERFAFPPTV